MPVVLKSDGAKKVAYTVDSGTQQTQITVEKLAGVLKFSFSVVRQPTDPDYVSWVKFCEMLEEGATVQVGS